jgi:hypothetical protein
MIVDSGVEAVEGTGEGENEMRLARLRQATTMTNRPTREPLLALHSPLKLTRT